MTFDDEVTSRLAGYSSNQALKEASKKFTLESLKAKYSYNFSWMGRPIIQYPQDIVAYQEIIWRVQPDLIIETGIAHGGSLILSASMLALLDMADGRMPSPSNPPRKVLGIDVDIRAHNRSEIEKHPLFNRIHMIEGSSISEPVINQVKSVADEYKKVLVCLDSNHTHEHVISELNHYAGLVSLGSYCIVYDTIIEELPEGMFPDRPWDKGDNPKTAVESFLSTNREFAIDELVDNKLQISMAPRGYLKRVR